MDSTSLKDKQIYKYTSNGVIREVYCTYIDYLFLKLYYDDNGLSEDEYKYFKEHQFD